MCTKTSNSKCTVAPSFLKHSSFFSPWMKVGLLLSLFLLNFPSFIFFISLSQFRFLAFTFCKTQNSSCFFPLAVAKAVQIIFHFYFLNSPLSHYFFTIPISLSYFHFLQDPKYLVFPGCCKCTANSFLPICKPFSNHFPTICKPHNEGPTNPPNHIIAHPSHHFA